MTIALLIALALIVGMGVAIYFQMKASQRQAAEQEQLLQDYQRRVDEQQKLLDDYRALEKKNRYLAVLVAAIVCPVVNSGIFFLGSLLFFIPLIEEAFNDPGHGVRIVLLTMIGGNFLFEILFNIVLSPVVIRLIDLGRKNRH